MKMPIPSNWRNSPQHVLAILAAAWFLSYLDRQVIALLVPDIKQDLGLSDIEIGIAQGVAFALLFTIAGLPIGRLVDAYNRRKILIIGVLVWSGATIACGLARNFTELFIARMIVGLGEACLAPAAVSIVADCFRPDRRGRAVGVMLTGGSMGAGASALFGGAILAAIPTDGLAGLEAWRWTFLAVGSPGGLVALLLLTISEPRRAEESGPRSLQGGPSLLDELRTNALLLVPLYLAFGINMLAAYGKGAWFATMLRRDHALSGPSVGAIVGSMTLALGILGPIVCGWLSDALAARRGVQGRMQFVCLLFAALILSGAILLVWPDLELTLFASGLQNLASAGIAASAIVVLQAVSSKSVTGQIVALYVVIVNVVGMALGPLLVATVTDKLFGDDNMLRISIAVTMISSAGIGLGASVSALRKIAPAGGNESAYEPSNQVTRRQ